MEEYNDDEGLIGQRHSRQTHPDERHKVLDHFLHKHPLKLADVDNEDSVICAGCEKQVLGQSYYCHSCDFCLHESCSNVPAQIRHFMHSCPLILVISSGGCDACGKFSKGFFYHCRRCRWNVDYVCTLKQLPSTSRNPETQEQIESLLHRHPLSIVKNIKEEEDDSTVEIIEEEEDDESICELCGELCFRPIYYECSVCNFYVHKSCVDIPRQLYSIYHGCRDFLVLLIRASYYCCVCEHTGFGVCYACIRCGFELHLKCALRFVGKIKVLQVEHTCHRTGALQKKTDCLGCKFQLEKPWSEHLLEVQTPIDPEHTIFLCKSTKWKRCNVCLDEFSGGLFFRCDKCDVNYDYECIYSMPTVKLADHDCHMLHVVDKAYGHAKCEACLKTCFDMTAFRCSKCKFTLHLLCGPLPYTIKDDEHMHFLTLEDYIIYGTHEQYCYFCEEKRDPLLPVYNCKRCSYTVELKCAMSEVMACLKGDRENHISLRYLNRPVTKKNKVIIKGTIVEKLEHNEVEQNNAINEGMSEEVLKTYPSSVLCEILDCFNEDEKNKFGDTIKRMYDDMTWVSEFGPLNYCSDEESFEDDSALKFFTGNTDENCEESHSILEISPYSEKAFIQFVEKLDSTIDPRKRIKLDLLYNERWLVQYGKYITRRIFIPMMKELVNGKHGDISSGSMLDPRVKSMCFIYLCEIIYSMQTTKVVQIKKEKLQTWWNRTKMLQFMGFKVDFIQDHLMLVARAYFGLRSRNFADETSQKQVLEIERLEKEIRVLKATVEELKVKYRNHLEYVESPRTPFMVKCFEDADEMKWRPAAYGLL